MHTRTSWLGGACPTKGDSNRLADWMLMGLLWAASSLPAPGYVPSRRGRYPGCAQPHHSADVDVVPSLATPFASAPSFMAASPSERRFGLGTRRHRFTFPPREAQESGMGSRLLGM